MSPSEQRISQARSQWRNGDVAGAERALREIIESADTESASHSACVLGLLLYEDGQLGRAGEMYQRAIDSGHPIHAQGAALAQGMLLTDEQELTEASQVLRFAGEGEDPDVAGRAHALLAQVLDLLGDPAGAHSAREKALNCDDPDVVAMATEHGARALGGGPNDEHLNAAYEQAWALLDQRRFEEAKPVLVHLVNSGHPEFASLAAFQLCSIHAAEGDLAAARVAAESIIALGNPDHVGRGHSCLGDVLRDLDEPQAAAAAYQRAAQDPCPDVQLHALVQSGQELLRLGEVERARETYQRVIDTGHEHYAVEALEAVAELLRDWGDIDGAMEAFGRVVDCGHAEKSPRAAYNLGALLFEREEWAAARHAFLRASESDDQELVQHASTALDLLAGRAWEEAPVLDPEDAGTLGEAGVPEGAGAPHETQEPAELHAAESAPAPTASDASNAVTEPDPSGIPEAVGEFEEAQQLAAKAVEAVEDGDVDTARATLNGIVALAAPRQSALAGISLGLLEAALDCPEDARCAWERAALEPQSALAHDAMFLRLLLDEPAGTAHPLLRARFQRQYHEQRGDAMLDSATQNTDPLVSGLAATLRAEPERAIEQLTALAGAEHPLIVSRAGHALASLLRDEAQLLPVLERAVRHGHPALLPWAAAQLGDLLMEREDFENAREALEIAASTDNPGILATVFGKLTMFYTAMADTDALDALCRRALVAGDAEVTAQAAFILGADRAREDDHDTALQLFDQVADSSASVALFGAFAGHALRREVEHAQDAFEQAAADENSSQHYTATRLCLDLAARGERDFSEWVLRLTIDSGHPELEQEAWFRLGELRAGNDDPEAALAAWQHAAEGPDPEFAATAENFGADLNRRRGRVESAPTTPTGGEPAEAGNATVGAEAASAHASASDQQVSTPGVGEERGLETAEQRGRQLLGAGKLEQATEALAEHHGSTAIAEFCTTAWTGDIRVVREAFDRLPVQEVAAGAEAALEIARAHLDGGDEATGTGLLRMLGENADPATAGQARIVLGDLAEEGGDRSSALGWFRRVMSSPVETVSAGGARRVARLLCELRDQQGAEQACRHALRLAAGHESMHAAVLLGHLRAVKADVDAAAEAWDHAEELAESARSCGAAFVELLRKLAGAGQQDRCGPLAERARLLDSPDAVAVGLSTLAGIAHGRGELQHAIDSYRRATEIEESRFAWDAQLSLALLLFDSGNAWAARAEFEQLSQCEEDRYAANGAYGNGLLLADSGNRIGAAAAFAQALSYRVPEVEEDALNSLRRLMRQQYENGDHVDAMTSLRLVADVADSAWAAWQACVAGAALADADHPSQAVLYLRCAVELGGEQPAPEALLRLGQILDRLGQGQEAQAVYARIPPSAGGTPESAAGPAADGRDDEPVTGRRPERVADDAVRDEQRSGRAAPEAARPGSAIADYALAQSLRSRGEMEEARESYLRVVRAEDPKFSGEAMLELGGIAYEADDDEAACWWYSRVAESDDEELAASAALNIAMVAKRRDDLESARPWLLGLVDSGHATAPMAAAHLAEMHYWRSEVTEAAELYEFTLANTTEPELVAESAYRLGEFHYQAGDSERAGELLRRSTQTGYPGFAADAAELLGKF